MLRLEFGSRRLVASGWMTVLALAGVLLFVQLGRWQWHRAAEKTALAAAFAAGTSAPALALGTRSTASLPRFAQVIVTGRYDPAHQFLLDNMSEGGQVGYQVLTPLRLEDGRWLLVNRGWVALPDGRRDRLPDVRMLEPDAAQLRGRLDVLPVTGLAAGRAPPAADSSWPKRTSFPTAEQLGAALGARVEPLQLLLGADERFGFRRNWRSAGEGLAPERHLGYALQWWGFAALTVFLYVFLNLERRGS
ncbi:MAG TPA: SURF1 family protein [Steroidobacteraceae bacterium]